MKGQEKTDMTLHFKIYKPTVQPDKNRNS